MITFSIRNEDGTVKRMVECIEGRRSNYEYMRRTGYVGPMVRMNEMDACEILHDYHWEGRMGEAGDYLVYGCEVYPVSKESYETKYPGMCYSEDEIEFEDRKWGRMIFGMTGADGPSKMAKQVAKDLGHLSDKLPMWESRDRALIMCELIRSYTAHQSPFLE